MALTAGDASDPEGTGPLPAPVGHRQEIRAISVVVPIFNESDSIDVLLTATGKVLRLVDIPFEIICVDDGSSDGSVERLRRWIEREPSLRIIRFRRNYGQTAALMAGIDHASGDVIVTMDADLQNDPEDIPRLIERIEAGSDVVCGWRKHRKDAAIRRNFISRVANRVISRISKVPLHDYGCTLKAFRADMIQGVRLYGEMHRFIPIYARWMGAAIEEIEVRHHARRFGQSKYGLERVLKVLLDLIVIMFLDRYLRKPIYVFGAFGALNVFLSFAALLYSLYLKFVEGFSLIQTPLPVFSGLTFLLGIISILMGLLAEMLVRTYFESQGRAAYDVRERINFPTLEPLR